MRPPPHRFPLPQLKLLSLILGLLFLPGLALGLEYHGETTLYQDTVWQGEVLIDGILTVAAGATLEIRPGTRVRFSRIDRNGDGIGESEIFCQGRLIARGSAEQPVVFTSAEPQPAPGDWGSLNMMLSEAGENLLEHCRVEYAYRGFHAHFSQARLRNSLFRRNQRGAQFQESTVAIENCSFSDNFNGLQFRDSKVSIDGSHIRGSHWGIRAVFVELQMRNSLVEGNRTNGVSLRDSQLQLEGNRILDNRRGIYLQRSQGQILGNQIRANREHGIYLEESMAEVLNNQLSGNGRSGVKIFNSGGRIADNRITANGEFSLFNAGSDDFQVEANWYGDQRQAELLDGRSRAGLGYLKIAPPLNRQPEVESP